MDRRAIVLATIALLTAGRAAGQEPTGTLVALQGSVQVVRAGAATPAGVGSQFAVGDAVRVETNSLARVVLRDGSLLVIGPDSTASVVEQRLGPPPRMRLRLDRGSMRIMVGDAYPSRPELYEVETPTAVARVRGTDFMVVMDPVQNASKVIVVTSQVEVYSVIDRTNNGVLVRSHEMTTVRHGKLPTKPEPVTETVFRQYLDQLAFPAEGRADTLSLAVGDPLLAGQLVPDSDRAPSETGMTALTDDFGFLVPADPWPYARIGQQIPGFPGPFEQPAPAVGQSDVGVSF